MLFRSSVATIAGVAALCGTGLGAQSQAASPSPTLLVRPGVGIGPVDVGETFTALQMQFPHVTVRGGLFSLRIDGKTIRGFLTDNRVTEVHSTSSNLVLGTRRLQDHRASETQNLVNAGWTMSTCIPNHTLVYRRGPEKGRVTAIAWTAGAPPLALIQPRIPTTWTHCAKSNPPAG